MSENFVVPDAVGVVEGWKAFAVMDDGVGGGQLLSPQKGNHWLPDKRFVAHCEFNDGTKRVFRNEWMPIGDLLGKEYVDLTHQYDKDQNPMPTFTISPSTLSTAAMPGSVPKGPVTLVPVTTPSRNFPSKPQTLLPNGEAWALAGWNEFVPPCKSPAENCECGVHIASDFSEAYGYRGSSESSMYAMVKVKGWGKVIPCEHGWKSEFAYVSEIYTDSPLDLSAYRVPVCPLFECGHLSIDESEKSHSYELWIFVLCAIFAILIALSEYVNKSIPDDAVAILGGVSLALAFLSGLRAFRHRIRYQEGPR